jgi:MarR family transcriptional regulator for hemolysin
LPFRNFAFAADGWQVGFVIKPTDNPQLDFVRECVLLARKWRAYSDEQLRALGMTQARATVLYWLDVSPGTMTQRQLADIVGIEGPTLVRQLHALEAMGIIERVPMPGDRRAKGIRLTPAAEPVLVAVREVADRMSHDCFDRLDKRRLSSATQLVRDARAAFD